MAGSGVNYYYNDNWQVVAECILNAQGSETSSLRTYVYGNYIDEVLYMYDVVGEEDYYYLHDHLYSPVALLADAYAGNYLIAERYEYDAYGSAHIYTGAGVDGDWFTSDDVEADPTASAKGNSYLFTGRRLDILDGGSSKIYYYRNRYYDPHTGRFLTHDPLGITPNPQKPNVWYILSQYNDGSNLYNYALSNPLIVADKFGLEGGGEEYMTVTGDGVFKRIEMQASKADFFPVHELEYEWETKWKCDESTYVPELNPVYITKSNVKNNLDHVKLPIPDFLKAPGDIGVGEDAVITSQQKFPHNCLNLKGQLKRGTKTLFVVVVEDIVWAEFSFPFQEYITSKRLRTETSYGTHTFKFWLICCCEEKVRVKWQYGNGPSIIDPDPFGHDDQPIIRAPLLGEEGFNARQR